MVALVLVTPCHYSNYTLFCYVGHDTVMFHCCHFSYHHLSSIGYNFASSPLYGASSTRCSTLLVGVTLLLIDCRTFATTTSLRQAKP